ncbi:MAG: AlbA family DNA-binding domain-containing protein [Planctomycetota bacterium]|jgi:hypothetical protein
MSPQAGQLERVSVYRGGHEQKLELVRSIAALANSGGGTVLVERVEAGGSHLETPAVAEMVNRYLAPPLRNLVSIRQDDGSIAIDVPDSGSRPHLFARDGSVGDGESLFHTGQIWVRRNGVNRPGDAEDVRRLVREAAAEFLERLSIGVRDPSFALRLTESAGIAVHLAEDEESVPVSPNLARLYPYTTKTLGQRLGRTTNWVATASKVLRLKDSRDNAYGVPAPGGDRIVQWRYSDHALHVLEGKLRADPSWDPYHELS